MSCQIITADFSSENRRHQYIEQRLQNARNSSSETFYARATDNAMSKFGIRHGDLLVVDQSITPQSGDFVLVRIGDGVAVRQLQYHNEQNWLIASNTDLTYALSDLFDGHVLGVVIKTVHAVKRSQE